ncbi:DNA methyltransferase [Synechococcus virus S-ESS1]|uniref:DNA methyltransferase n=1 Tax=Synechococcus virus S-ESS1 TaxID=1964565 RepID=A0A1V0DX34_9CAUD|nr:DNA methyltransferase [Synechococcus virus S-ESS1]ARB05726.1 DNA methyltransferase [Synechococcus virus S-ESS1]
MTEPTCQFCGLVDKTRCRTADEAEDCRHAPVEGKGPIVRTGPMAGLRRVHYGVIYADPPWSFKTYSNRDEGTVPHRSSEAPYRSMTAEQLVLLPVEEVAAKDCVLHMWVISSHIDQALALGRAWGFTFKSLGLVWVKTQKGDPETPKMGMGKWFRQEVEMCLLFTRGKPSRASAGVRQTILEPAREHSRKPDVGYERVEALSAGPYLEMFSRSSRPGWDCMGDQVGKFDPLDPLEAAEIEDLI